MFCSFKEDLNIHEREVFPFHASVGYYIFIFLKLNLYFLYFKSNFI